MENPAIARAFVHAHHVEPLAEGGADVGENLVVLCPNCHARLHARTFAIEPREDGLYLMRRDIAPRRLAVTTPQAVADLRQEAVCAQIRELFSRLSPELQSQLVRALADQG